MIALMLVSVFLAAAFLYLALSLLLRNLNARPINRRLAWIAQESRAHTAKTAAILRDDQLSQIPLLNRWLEHLDVSKNLQRLISQADVSMTVGQLVLLMLILGGLGLLMNIKSGNPLLMAGCALGLGSVPLVYVLQRRRTRLKLFVQQFPDALDMMTSALQAGQAFSRALQMVAFEAPAPIGIEFRKTYEEQNLGLSMKEALINFTRRIDSVDLKLFVTAVLIQKESGGNLTEILTKISQTIRARFKLLGQIKVLTAQGRLAGWVLGSLPIALGLLITMINKDYMMAFIQEPIGRLMLAVALTLQIIGFVVMNRIVRMKVD